jgi:iron complex transport system permease protein
VQTLERTAPDTPTPTVLPTAPRRTAFRRRLVLTGLAGALVGVAALSCGLGAVPIAGRELLAILLDGLGLGQGGFEESQRTVLLVIRLPRVLLGVLVGAALGMAGAAMQGLFRNPLADPGLIGISSGASLAAVLMIVLGVSTAGAASAGGFIASLTGLAGYYALSLAAFAGACLTTLLVYQLSRSGGRAVITTMLLVGIAANALTQALTGLLISVATDAQLRSITFWGLGSLAGASWEAIQTITPLLAVPLLGLPRLSKALNTLTLGEAEAQYLGTNVRAVKRAVIVLTTLAVGVSVSVAGTIGFIGLVMPHLLRLVLGADHRAILPGSALLGATVLTGADLLARTVVAPAELPIGILTAFIGAPVFLSIILKNRTLMRE